MILVDKNDKFNYILSYVQTRTSRAVGALTHIIIVAFLWLVACSIHTFLQFLGMSSALLVVFVDVSCIDDALAISIDCGKWHWDN